MGAAPEIPMFIALNALAVTVSTKAQIRITGSTNTKKILSNDE